MKIQPFCDTLSHTLSYVVWGEGPQAFVVDPVLSKEFFQGVQQCLKGRELTHSFETHIHADHPSGAKELKNLFPRLRVMAGEGVRRVQEIFVKLWGQKILKESSFDHFLADGEVISVGDLQVKTIATPGHTPSCVCYLVNGGALFTGDTLFMPDSGTGRCDFPGGDGGELYDSVTQKIYTLPPETQMYVGHDYGPGGRPIAFQTSVAAQKRENIHIREGVQRGEYSQMRAQRDKTLPTPQLYEKSVLANVLGGGCFL